MLKKKYLWLVLGLIVLYLVTHIFHLTALPVFADEAIYIRWSQLIMDDWSRYLFFPLNDGKTPLFVWLMVPFLQVWQDPLFAGRLVSVITGLVQVWLMASITYQLTNKRSSALMAGLLTSFLPFWFFHQRMALMDGLLAVWLSLALLASIKVSQMIAWQAAGWRLIKWQIALAVGLGLGFWTKLPAVLALPMLFLTPWLVGTKSKINVHPIATKKRAGLALINQVAHSWCLNYFKIYFVKLFWPVLAGLVFFLTLKFQPAFSQLFGRGGDFLYGLDEFLAGGWWSSIRQWPKYALVIWQYLTPMIALLPLAGLATKRARTHFWLILMALSYALPIMFLGKVVYARYLLPMAIPLTLSASIGLGDFLHRVQRQKELKRRLLWSLVAVLVVANLMGPVTQNLYYAWFDTDHLPLVAGDKVQYLNEWSSGHGIKETTQLILAQAKTSRVAVATEGYFGTLPDGILMYLHNRDVLNIKVEGIGQPVREIPSEFLDSANEFDQVWLVVNSHRNFLKLDPSQLLAQYCRPDPAICLEVWRLR